MENTLHPRPDFKRSSWETLDGTWDFAFDDTAIGEKQKWFRGGNIENEIFIKKIQVPFCYQSPASGIADTSYHPVFWYSKTFNLSNVYDDKRVMLHFGAVDFECKVWINGMFAGTHKGGYTPFSFDISNMIERTSSNRVTVMVIDRNDTDQPRGKQYWKETNDRCWYTPSSGIWQTVWLEAVSLLHITSLTLKPDVDTSSVSGSLRLNAYPEQRAELQINLQYKNKTVQTASFSVIDQRTSFVLCLKEEDEIEDLHYWSPESPNLYTITCRLIYLEEETNKTCSIDEVESYFGMRKIDVQNGQIFLNNKPLYQRLILDQAYWEEGFLTPPSPESFRQDVELIKSLGFNGVRLHQKIEAPQFYYWADMLGLLVWGEMPSAYRYSRESCEHIVREWTSFIERDMNHPSIICWVPFNESWGVRNVAHDTSQQEFTAALYHLTKALDGTRLVSTNDGWEQTITDICGIHDYVRDGNLLSKKLANLPRLLKGSPQNRMLYADGFSYRGEPILITEFGGIAFSSEMNEQNWGYSGGVTNTADFLERLKGLVDAILACDDIQGYCYTQFSDLMQEVNGLCYMNRKLKIAPEILKEIFGRSHSQYVLDIFSNND